nr:hypothetical protein [Halomonas socia]
MLRGNPSRGTNCHAPGRHHRDLDAICPWCFIGKRHLDLALAQPPEALRQAILEATDKS